MVFVIVLNQGEGGSMRRRVAEKILSVVMSAAMAMACVPLSALAEVVETDGFSCYILEFVYG